MTRQLIATRCCHACKTAPWLCRGCGIYCCEHYCKNKVGKPDGTALCGRCARKGLFK
jgi:hypothetical protein